MTARKWAEIRKALTQGDCYNKQVREWFKDADENETRLTLRDLCLIESKDSIAIAQQKIRFFREEVQKTHLKPTVVGQPKYVVDADIKYHPQIVIYFAQDKASVPEKEDAVTARVSFRLINETSESLTNAELNSWANKIHTRFFGATPYRFRKGKVIAWYTKPEDGFHLQVYGYSKQDGRAVVEDVVGFAGKTFSAKHLKYSDPERSNTETPEKMRILGELRDEPKWRPNAYVTAAYAYATIWNDNNIRMLVDNTGLQVNPIIRS